MRNRHERRALKRGLLRAALCLMTAAGTQASHAQKPSSCICSENFAMVTLTLVDSNGVLVQDANERVGRLRSGMTRSVPAGNACAAKASDEWRSSNHR